MLRYGPFWLIFVQNSDNHGKNILERQQKNKKNEDTLSQEPPLPPKRDPPPPKVNVVS